MAVQTDHSIGFGHHHMQVVADHQNAAARRVADLPNQIVQCHFARKVDTLYGLVEHQQIRFSDHGAGKQHALEFAARELLHGRLEQMCRADSVQCGSNCAGRKMSCQRHQALYSQRQCPVDREFLRHVADLQTRLPRHCAHTGLEDPGRQFGGG